MPSYEHQVRPLWSRPHPSLTLDEVVELCHQYAIHATVPLSQLEAEAVHRGLDLTTIVRAHLIQRLKEVGAF